MKNDTLRLYRSHDTTLKCYKLNNNKICLRYDDAGHIDDTQISVSKVITFPIIGKINERWVTSIFGWIVHDSKLDEYIIDAPNMGAIFNKLLRVVEDPEYDPDLFNDKMTCGWLTDVRSLIHGIN